MEEDKKDEMMEKLATTMANGWIGQAINTAETEEQVDFQLNTIKEACLHVLSTLGFNFAMQNGEGAHQYDSKVADKYIEHITKALRDNMNFLNEQHKSGELDFQEVNKGD